MCTLDAREPMVLSQMAHLMSTCDLADLRKMAAACAVFLLNPWDCRVSHSSFNFQKGAHERPRYVIDVHLCRTNVDSDEVWKGVGCNLGQGQWNLFKCLTHTFQLPGLKYLMQTLVMNHSYIYSLLLSAIRLSEMSLSYGLRFALFLTDRLAFTNFMLSNC